MTHYHRITRCPKCHIVTERTTGLYSVGCPRRTCRNCGFVYYDPAYIEYAIDYYNTHQPKPGNAFLAICVFLPLALLTIFLTYMQICKEGVNGLSIFSFCLALGSTIVAILAIRSTIVNIARNRDREGYLHKLQNDMEENLKLSSETKDNLLAESMRRLSNPEYIDYLANHGADIPNYFLERIGYKAEFTKKRSQIEAQNESDIDKLKKEQERWRTAKRYLLMGKTNKNFKLVAEKLGMSLDEYKDYCQKIVDNYEELHRQYNATHITPAEYPSIDD